MLGCKIRYGITVTSAEPKSYLPCCMNSLSKLDQGPSRPGIGEVQCLSLKMSVWWQTKSRLGDMRPVLDPMFLMQPKLQQYCCHFWDLPWTQLVAMKVLEAVTVKRCSCCLLPHYWPQQCCRCLSYLGRDLTLGTNHNRLMCHCWYKCQGLPTLI